VDLPEKLVREKLLAVNALALARRSKVHSNCRARADERAKD
jgi:hypothetical protein